MGKLDSLTNQDKADLNEDGKITAYDAELFLSRLGQCVVELPANGEVKVTVTITLPDAVKEELDKVFTNGAYIEAYTYATPSPRTRASWPPPTPSPCWPSTADGTSPICLTV